MYDASNRKEIRAAEKAAHQDNLARIEYLKAAMSTWQGRAWFHDLLEFCHLFSDPFTGQALHEAYLKGERNVGLRIFADIVTHCPDHYLQMMREANARRSERDSRTSSDDDEPSAAERASSEGAGWDSEEPGDSPASLN